MQRVLKLIAVAFAIGAIVGVVITLDRLARWQSAATSGRTMVWVEPEYPTAEAPIELRVKVRGGVAIAIETIEVTGAERPLVISGRGRSWNERVTRDSHTIEEHVVAVNAPARSAGTTLTLGVHVTYVIAHRTSRFTFEEMRGNDFLEVAVPIVEPATATRMRAIRAALAILALGVACLVAVMLVPRLLRWIGDDETVGRAWILLVLSLAGFVAYCIVGYAWFARSIVVASGASATWLVALATIAWIVLPTVLAVWRSRRDERPRPEVLGLRAHEVNKADPYRDELCEPRVVEPRPLADVIAAVQASGLSPRIRRGGFELRRGRTRLRARVADPARVDPSSLQLVSDSYDLQLELALALVTLYGPLAAQAGAAGWFVVDGLRDRAALHAALDSRFRTLAHSADRPL